jgi:hypothetical protein
VDWGYFDNLGAAWNWNSLVTGFPLQSMALDFGANEMWAIRPGGPDAVYRLALDDLTILDSYDYGDGNPNPISIAIDRVSRTAWVMQSDEEIDIFDMDDIASGPAATPHSTGWGSFSGIDKLRYDPDTDKLFVQDSGEGGKVFSIAAAGDGKTKAIDATAVVDEGTDTVHNLNLAVI